MAFHLNFNEDLWIGVFVFSASCLMLMLSVFIFIIYRLSCIKDKITRPVKIYSLLSLCLFFISELFMFLFVLYVKMPNGHVNEYTQSLWGLFNTFHDFAYFFTYFLWFNRIRAIFGETMHALKQQQCTIFYILLTLYIIIQESNTLIWELFIFNKLTWQQFSNWYSPLLSARFIIDFVLNAYVIYLFCSKLWKITLLHQANRANEASVSAISTHSTASIMFSSRVSVRIFDTMVKYFLLTFTTVLSTQIFTISQILLSVSITHAVNTDNYTFYYNAFLVSFIWNNIDAIVSTGYIVLSFGFAKTYYVKTCSCVHGKCVKLWAKTLTATVAAGQEIKLKKQITIASDTSSYM